MCWRPGHRCMSPVSTGASLQRSSATRRICRCEHMARDTLIQTLLILLVITLVVMFLATSFVRPVNDLIARVQLARTGKTDMTFAAESTDEIGDLARSFRELIDSVQKQTRMLEEATSENQLLLENVMPKGMAQRVRFGQGQITEQIDDVTVVFAELKGLAAIHAGDVRHRIGCDAEAADRGVRRGRRATRCRTDQDGRRYVSGRDRSVAAAARSHAPHGRVRAVGARDRRRLQSREEREPRLDRWYRFRTGHCRRDGSGAVPVPAVGRRGDRRRSCDGLRRPNEIVVTRAVRDGLSDQYAFKPLQASTVRRPVVDARNP